METPTPKSRGRDPQPFSIDVYGWQDERITSRDSNRQLLNCAEGENIYLLLSKRTKDGMTIDELRGFPNNCLSESRQIKTV